MSVATKNPFALLDDDGSSPAPVASVTKAPTPAAPAASTRRTANRARGGPASRGGKYPPRGGARTAPVDGAGNLNQNGVDEPSTEGRNFDGRGRGRGGARGGDRGARGARGRGGRSFDKHSQSGKVDSDKKIHQSWGGDEGTTELKAEEGAVKDATAETADEWGTATPAVEGAAAEGADKGSKPRRERGERGDREREPREPEEEDNTLTLEQYLAEKKAKEDGIVPKLEGFRAANDGADDLWKDAVALEKADDEAYFAAKAKSTPKQRAKKEEKVFIEIEGRFERPNTGSTRGRGGDRGGRGRGGDRGSGRGRGADRGADRGRGGRGGRANAGPTVSVDDETAFPSLS